MMAQWNRRKFLKSGAALSGLFAAPNRVFCQEKSERLPNIVFLMADDLGYGDLGCYGSPDILTPAIDQLARQGVRFTQYYANAPECTPTRTALLTGRYQQRVGGLECAIGVGNVGRYDDAIRLAEQHDLGLPSSEMTISRLLKQAGYATAVIGKWHLGYEAKFNPLHHGFDYFFGALGGAVDYFHHTEPDGKSQLYLNREPVKRDGYLTDLITEESLQFIQRQKKNKPFFLYVPYTAPHAPYQGPNDSHEKPLGEDGWNQGSRETYVKMVERMDWSVGRILEALEKQGFSENTLVVFCSDNGGAKYADNGPLARGKGTAFEGGVRVPCIIRWPGRITQSNRTDRVAMTMDLTASLARIAGVQFMAGRSFDGIDIIGDIEQDRATLKRTLYWRKRRGDQTWRAVRDGSMKYISDQRGEE
ncbi:MAG: sulfatase-like hydrolase/transferase, partial [Candidatus Omnitrophica bacterium]|nr:sulfatase-like hydrolase/transferase [Candidatus Omnitrophota bacterium]